MTLPPWKPSNETEREAFINFVIGELDAADHAMLTESLSRIAATNPESLSPESRVAFIRAIAEIGLPEGVTERVSALAGVDLAGIASKEAQLRAIGFDIKHSKKGGAKSELSEDFKNAKSDVARIRAIFVRHWQQRNRHYSPLAEEIAARRWKLSDAETDILIARVQRPGNQKT